MRSLLSIMLVVFVSGCGSRGSDSDTAVPSDVFAGGNFGTVFDGSSFAFRTPIAGLSRENEVHHLAGDGVFESRYVTAPSPVNPGLGPQYNNTGCDSCHLKEGRGRPRIERGPQGSELLIFVSMPNQNDSPSMEESPLPVPDIGLQVLDQAIFSAQPNAVVALKWVDGEEQFFSDGAPYRLRQPDVTITYPDGQSLPANVQVSLRQPLPVFGLGLIESIPVNDILENAGRDDKVKGKMNLVIDQETGNLVYGRFGRKATQPSILHQTAKAFALDIGVLNTLFDPKIPPEQEEISRTDVESAAFYLRTLGVPARRNWNDPNVVAGRDLFTSSGCVGCHQPQWKTGDHAIESLANQVIYPYSDFLLHDMGAGLADNRPEFAASGSEWRTPTLWGIGMTETILQNPTYLHDGRARSITEAILWHGGQASLAKKHFLEMGAEKRDQLLTFLKSL